LEPNKWSFLISPQLPGPAVNKPQANLVCVLIVNPEFIVIRGFLTIGCRSTSSRHDYGLYSKPFLMESHDLQIPLINLSSQFREHLNFISLLNIQRTSLIHGRPTVGEQRAIRRFNKRFHSSSPGSRLQTTNLVNRALL
jgi:hypothetical protein